MKICDWCMSPPARPFALGPDQGNQRDSYRETIDLCPPCEEALLTKDLSGFHARFTVERTLLRGT